MRNSKLVVSYVVTYCLIALISSTLSAQSFAPSADQPSGLLAPPKIAPMPVLVEKSLTSKTELGSISGRVFNDAEIKGSQQSNTPLGIAGVRIILRTKDGSTIVANRLSSIAGLYDFAEIRPGQYSLEVDETSVPSNFRCVSVKVASVIVEPAVRTGVDLPITARRTVKGIVFIDKNGDGRYQLGKEEPVEGTFITGSGRFAVSSKSGAYILNDLPAGRIALLISRPKQDVNTHVVLILGTGPVANRTVDVPVSR